MYGILITVLLGGFAFFTFQQAADAATRATTKEFATTKVKIDELLDSAQIAATAAEARAIELSEKATKIEELLLIATKRTADIEKHANLTQQLSADAQAALRKFPGTAPATPLPPAEQAELAAAATTAEATPRKERTADEFRLLMFSAEQKSDWAEYVNLADGMAYLYGDSPVDLAFALFGKAYGEQMRGHLDLSARAYADYIERCPNDISDNHASALSNWGTALSVQARTKTGAEADSLSAEAGAKYAAALAIKPDMHDALNNWGNAFMVQAQTKSGAEADGLYAEAEQNLARAEAMFAGSGAYNISCLNGLRGDAAAAADWLRKAKLTDINCPDCEHIRVDGDFDRVRDSPEFVAALTDIGC